MPQSRNNRHIQWEENSQSFRYNSKGHAIIVYIIHSLVFEGPRFYSINLSIIPEHQIHESMNSVLRQTFPAKTRTNHCHLILLQRFENFWWPLACISLAYLILEQAVWASWPLPLPDIHPLGRIGRQRMGLKLPFILALWRNADTLFWPRTTFIFE